jgi:hypothetical protein
MALASQQMALRKEKAMMALNWLQVAVPSNEMMPQSKTSLESGVPGQHPSRCFEAPPTM